MRFRWPWHKATPPPPARWEQDAARAEVTPTPYREAIQAGAWESLRGELTKTPIDGRLLAELQRAVGDAHYRKARAFPDDLAVTIARHWQQRGRRPEALAWLADNGSLAGMLLRAELLLEDFDPATRRDDGERALAILLAVLREYGDVPTVRERCIELRRQLGGRAQPEVLLEGGTLLATREALPFTLLAEVARGGSGVVYQAQQQLGNRTRPVAVKIAHPGERARAALLDEARIAVLLRGPFIVPVIDIDPANGWLATLWAPGGSLEQRRIAGRLPTTRWLPALLQALAAIHACGWVHGDIKPHNVLFDGEDSPWLSDFGSARRIGEAPRSATAKYASPERTRGAACHPADDVYALGVLLSELVAQTPARLGADAASYAEPIARCLAPRPERWPDAERLLRALSER